jgi:hypothetical protein
VPFNLLIFIYFIYGLAFFVMGTIVVLEGGRATDERLRHGLRPLAVFAIEIGWYAVVALALSASGPRAVYLRAKAVIDRTAGAVMGLLGLKLITAADTAI